MHTIKVTRYTRVGSYLQPHAEAEYYPQTLKEHDDLVIKLFNQYGDRRDIRITGPNAIYKEVDPLLVWRPEHPKDELLFNLICPSSDMRTWRAAQCHHDTWYYLSCTWGYEGFNDGFYLSWGQEKRAFAPLVEECIAERWLYNYQFDELLKEAREKYNKDLRCIPLQLWKHMPLTWQQGLQVCDTW